MGRLAALSDEKHMVEMCNFSDYREKTHGLDARILIGDTIETSSMEGLQLELNARTNI